MYPNKDYYLKELTRARQRVTDDMNEEGPDYDHVILDALNHLEGAIQEGFTPWNEYDGPAECYHVEAEGASAMVEIWGENLEDALQVFRKEFPRAVPVSVKRVHRAS